MTGCFMMYHYAVSFCLVLFLSGIICNPTSERRDNSEFQKLLNVFKGARKIKSRLNDVQKLRDLEIDLLTKRILNKLATEDEHQNERENTKDEVSEIDKDLRKLGNMLNEDVINDLIARAEDLLAESTVENFNELPRGTQVRQVCYWWYPFCGTDTTKFHQDTTNTKSDNNEKKPAED